jgi:hypothetical protein
MRLLMMNRSFPGLGWIKNLFVMVVGAAAYVGIKAALTAAKVNLPPWM